MIQKFSKEVIEKINHYVYRLVDPRNGHTFYVGEGCGNRIFAHANAVDMNFYQSEFATEQDKITEDNDDPAKSRQRIVLLFERLQSCPAYAISCSLRSTSYSCRAF